MVGGECDWDGCADRYRFSVEVAYNGERSVTEDEVASARICPEHLADGVRWAEDLISLAAGVGDFEMVQRIAVDPTVSLTVPHGGDLVIIVEEISDPPTERRAELRRGLGRQLPDWAAFHLDVAN